MPSTRVKVSHLEYVPVHVSVHPSYSTRALGVISAFNKLYEKSLNENTDVFSLGTFSDNLTKSFEHFRGLQLNWRVLDAPSSKVTHPS